MILVFTPKSIYDYKISNIRGRFYWQIFDETHMNLQRAKIADLSRITISDT
jgi:hypothetical protein